MAATVSGVLLTGNHASRPTSGLQAGTLYACSTHSLIYQTSDTGSTWATWATLGTTETRASLGLATSDSPQFTAIELGNASDTTIARVSAGVVSIEGTNIVKAGAVTTDGITMSTAKLLGRTTASTGAVEEISAGNGLLMSSGSLTAAAYTIVTQGISADFTTASDSAWHDVTGLTGISLVAGTWTATVDIEHVCTTNYGPVFRLTDGTTTYAQMAYIGNYLATVSTHQTMNALPFALGSTTSVKVQVFSDTVFTIKKYPTRGADSGIQATHVMCQRVA